MHRRDRGVTLIELVVVVAIIGILAAIAYPSYQRYVERTRRADAESALSGLASALERYYTENMSYKGAADSSGVPLIFASESPVDGATKFYDLRVSSVDSDSYTLKATPKNAQTGDGFLQLDNTGAKAWDRNNDGSISSGEKCWKDSC